MVFSIKEDVLYFVSYRGVEGHRHGKYPWAFVEGYIVKQMANLVGK